MVWVASTLVVLGLFCGGVAILVVALDEAAALVARCLARPMVKTSDLVIGLFMLGGTLETIGWLMLFAVD